MATVSQPTQRFVFVGGLHRSGTSIVARCIAAHPFATPLTGTGMPEDEGQHVQSVFPPATELGGPGRFAFAAGAHLTEASPLASPSSRERLLREWAPHWQDASRPILVEKSPPNMLRMRLLQALFPDASFVVVVRHPGIVALATRRWNDDPLASLLEHWFRAHEILAGDLPHVERVHVIRYERLVADPSRTLDELGSFLELDAVPDQGIQQGRSARHELEWVAARERNADSLERFTSRGALYGYSL